MAKLKDSRIIKFSLIALTVLTALHILALVGAAYLTNSILILPIEELHRIQVVSRIIELLLKSSSIGAIGTIVTAVIARYGLREATKNIHVNEDKPREILK